MAAAVDADPADLAATAGLVRVRWALREADAARQALAELARQAAEHPAVLVAQGTLALGLRDHPLQHNVRYGAAGRSDPDALAAFRAAAQRTPESLPAWRGLAITHRLAWRIDEAHEALDRAERATGGHPALVVERAWCRFDAGHFDRAVDALAPLVDRDRPDREALFAMAAAARDARQFDRARAAVDALARQCPDHPLVWLEAGWLDWRAAPCEPDPDRFRAMLESAVAGFEAAHTRWPDCPAVAYAMHYQRIYAAESTDVADDAGRLFTGVDPPGPLRLLASAERLARHADLATEEEDGEQADDQADHRVREHREQALAELASARAADPHVLTVHTAEASQLARLTRYQRARQLLSAELAHCPDSPWLHRALGWVEYAADRDEAAVALFQRAGDDEDDGLVHALSWLGCFGLAEQAAERALADRPADVYLHTELGRCAFDEGRYFSAEDRFHEALRWDEDHPDALEWLRRTVRRLRWRRPHWLWQKVEESASRYLADDSHRHDQLSAYLPDQTPYRLRAALRRLDSQVARARAWPDALLDEVLLVGWLLLMLLGALLGPLLTARSPLVDGSLSSYLVQLAAILVGAGLLVWLLMRHVPDDDRKTIGVLLGLSMLDLAGLAWVTTRPPDQFAPALLIALAAAGYLLLATWLALLGLGVAILLSGRAISRAHAQVAVGSIADALLELLDRLGYEPGLVQRTTRAECVGLLEQVARGLERVIGAPERPFPLERPLPPRRPPPPQRQASRADTRVLALASRRRAAGVAAAIRDLKDVVLHPTPGSWPDLRDRLDRMLVSTAHGYWGDLAVREPDPVRKTLPRQMVVALRALLIIGIPPGALVLYQLGNGESPLDLPLEVALAGYLAWPLLSVMWWLDPNLAEKVATIRGGRELRDTRQPRRAGR